MRIRIASVAATAIGLTVVILATLGNLTVQATAAPAPRSGHGTTMMKTREVPPAVGPVATTSPGRGGAALAAGNPLEIGPGGSFLTRPYWDRIRSRRSSTTAIPITPLTAGSASTTARSRSP